MEDRSSDWLIKFVSMSTVLTDNYVVFNIPFTHLSKISTNFHSKYGRSNGMMGESPPDLE